MTKPPPLIHAISLWGGAGADHTASATCKCRPQLHRSLANPKQLILVHQDDEQQPAGSRQEAEKRWPV